MKVVGIFAHADDECLGAGGALAKHAMGGDDVSLVFFTDGVTSRAPHDHEAVTRRRLECDVAARALGITGDMFHGDLADQELDMVALVDLSRRVLSADIIYTHWIGDVNQDHRRVAEAVLIATRPCAGSTVKRVLACEIVESTSQAFGLLPPFVPTVFVSLDDDAAERKLSALACYGSERRAWPHPRSVQAVRQRMEMWGGVAGVARAEVFVLVREII